MDEVPMPPPTSTTRDSAGRLFQSKAVPEKCSARCSLQTTDFLTTKNGIRRLKRLNPVHTNRKALVTKCFFRSLIELPECLASIESARKWRCVRISGFSRHRVLQRLPRPRSRLECFIETASRLQEGKLADYIVCQTHWCDRKAGNPKVPICLDSGLLSRAVSTVINMQV